MVPVSFCEKIRAGRSEIFFFKYSFHGFVGGFCWAIFSTVPTSILTGDAYFLWTNLGNLVFWFNNYCDNRRHFGTLYKQPATTRKNRVARAITLKKIIGSAQPRPRPLLGWLWQVNFGLASLVNFGLAFGKYRLVPVFSCEKALNIKK